VRSAYLGPQRFNVLLTGLFAIIALVLGAVGLYGVAAFSVEQRRREIGVRMTLGASRADVLRLVVAQGAKLALVGLLTGFVAAAMLTRTIAVLLYGIGPHDPLTFLSVGVLLFVVAILATYLPARRAMRVDPAAALRYE